MTIVHRQDAGPLRQMLETAAAFEGCALKDLTVLATQHDPFRIDTRARRRDGGWLAEALGDLGLSDQTIHLRGIHYAVIGRPKPNGLPYTNTDADWTWLNEHAGKAARWLGYVAFEQIIDARNTPPTVRLFEAPEPTAYINVGIEVDVPTVDEIVPEVNVDGFEGIQPYKLVIFGEKSSLEAVLCPVAEDHQADLYLPTGEISDTLLHQMARVAEADGRPMVVFCFSDADTAGWQMPISIACKLQAFKTLGYALDAFQVRRVALTPDQVQEYGLPSTPLKATELRGDKWRADMGVEQTEIDALASLQPELLRQLVTDAMAPFFDATLASRVAHARERWLTEAQGVVDDEIDGDRTDRLLAEATVRLANVREQIEAINDALRVDTADFDLPDIVIPAASVDGEGHGLPLLDSRWSFTAQRRALIDSKAYRSNGSTP